MDKLPRINSKLEGVEVLELLAGFPENARLAAD